MSWSVAFMVVAIVLIASIAGVLKTRMKAQQGIRRDMYGNEHIDRDDPEVLRMREDMKVLKDRVAVLERIATDQNHALEDEIAKLRDS